jgi:hypothetical protein
VVGHHWSGEIHSGSFFTPEPWKTQKKQDWALGWVVRLRHVPLLWSLIYIYWTAFCKALLSYHWFVTLENKQTVIDRYVDYHYTDGHGFMGSLP